MEVEDSDTPELFTEGYASASSAVTDHGQGVGHCGYCGSDASSISHGMRALTLTVRDYQDLIDQGWRRAGTYLYKPNMEKTCCKLYTIRLDVERFQANKAQHKLLNKWRRYLQGEPGQGAIAVDPAPGPQHGHSSSATVASVLGPKSAGSNGAAHVEPSLANRHTIGIPSTGETAAAAPDDQELQRITALLQAALSLCVAQCQLPEAMYPRLCVTRPSAKQQTKLLAAAGACQFTSPAAFSICAAAKKAAGAAAEKATGVGTGLQEASRQTDKQVATPGVLTHGSQRAQNGAEGKRVPWEDSGKADAMGCSQGVEMIVNQQESSLSGGPTQFQPELVASQLADAFNAEVKKQQAQQQLLDSHSISSQEHHHSRGVASRGEVGQVGRTPGSGDDGTHGHPHGGSNSSSGALTGRVQCVQQQQHTDGPPSFRDERMGMPYRAVAVKGHINIYRGEHLQAATGSGSVAGAATGSASCAMECSPLVEYAGAPSSGKSKGKGICSENVAATSDSRGTSSAPSAYKAGLDRGCAPSTAAPQKESASTTGSPWTGQASALSTNAYEAFAALADHTAGRFELRTVPSVFDELEYQLYCRYQVAQHGDKPDELSRSSYKNFLVNSPLVHVSQAKDPSAPDCGYGSFHQQYWLDGKLVAVGVVDILPRCLSSVYLFWDPSLPSLALGKFSALQEIRWVQRAHAAGCSPALRYYYMGFYIHTCPKMRYKADYAPSELLCPQQHMWVEINPQIMAALDQAPLTTLSQVPGVSCSPNLATCAGAAPRSKDLEQRLPDVTLAFSGHDELRMAWKVVKRAGVVPFKYWPALEKQIMAWLSVVGASWQSLAYQL